jgi:hypothetical protein
MSDSQVAKKGKKDTLKIEQWAETKDPFVNQLYKRLRNSQKKLARIAEVEQKKKEGEVQLKQEQIDMLARKGDLQAEMDEALSYLNLYKESFPENPAFANAGKKKAPKAEPVVVEAPVVVAEPAVDANKLVDDALSFVADTIILSTLNGAQGVALSGSNQSLNDSLAYIRSAWTQLTAGAGTWSAAKGHFVDVFSRLVFKSSTQVGSHTRQSYSDVHAFITAFSASEGQAALFSQERPV